MFMENPRGSESPSGLSFVRVSLWRGGKFAALSGHQSCRRSAKTKSEFHHRGAETRGNAISGAVFWGLAHRLHAGRIGVAIPQQVGKN